MGHTFELEVGLALIGVFYILTYIMITSWRAYKRWKNGKRSTGAILSLPAVAYGPSSPAMDSSECIICISEFIDGDELRILACAHGFHVNCVDQWARRHGTCPTCRVPFV